MNLKLPNLLSLGLTIFIVLYILAVFLGPEPMLESPIYVGFSNLVIRLFRLPLVTAVLFVAVTLLNFQKKIWPKYYFLNLLLFGSFGIIAVFVLTAVSGLE